MISTKLIPSRKQGQYLLFFAFLYVIPLLLADVYYKDDMLRAIEGYGWERDGRTLSTFLYQLISSGGSIIDFFPYSTILASVILSLAGFYVSIILGIGSTNKFSFSSLLLVTSPFMLENLTYRWDCLPMSMSIISIIIPFLYVDHKRKFLLISIIGIVFSLFTYQPSVIIYGLMVICLIISYCLNKTVKDIFFLIKYSLFAIVAGSIIYKIIEMSMGYKYYRGATTIFSTFDPLLSYSDRLSDCFMIMRFSTNLPTKLTFILIAVLFIVAFAKFALSNKNYIVKVIPILLILLIPLCVFFIPTILEDAPYQTRILVGFSFLFYAPLIFLNYLSSRFSHYLCIAIVLLSLPLMATYGNALKKQSDFEKFIVNNIASNIELVDKNLYIEGAEPWAPELSIALTNYPILYKLVPLNLEWYAPAFFVNNSYSKYESCKIHLFNDNYQFKQDVPILYKTNNYYVRSNGSIIILDFNKEEDVVSVTE